MNSKTRAKTVASLRAAADKLDPPAKVKAAGRRGLDLTEQTIYEDLDRKGAPSKHYDNMDMELLDEVALQTGHPGYDEDPFKAPRKQSDGILRLISRGLIKRRKGGVVITEDGLKALDKAERGGFKLKSSADLAKQVKNVSEATFESSAAALVDDYDD